MTTFAEIADAAAHLSGDEQTALLGTLQPVRHNRASLVKDVAEARAEFEAGNLRASSASDIVAEARGAS